MADRPAILILGGTREARDLARALCGRTNPGLRVITSLAGRTASPTALEGEIRRGGFGGTEGLADYLSTEQITCLVDATHPFAEQISRNALAAAKAVGIGCLRLERPPWVNQPGDRWIEVPDLETAAACLPDLGSRALLTVGSHDLAVFRAVQGPALFARMIENPAPGTLPEGCGVILERGPFDLPHELALFSRLEIDLLVTKNSGGGMTAAKLQAARELAIPVLMIARPALNNGPIAGDCAQALCWIDKKLDENS